MNRAENSAVFAELRQEKENKAQHNRTFVLFFLPFSCEAIRRI
jgi:hypothetical protein